ncbi:hypothetical protein Tco_0970842 [Tanacetum coccineum]
MAANRKFVQLDELRRLANSDMLRDQLLIYFDMKTQREVQLATEINNLTKQLLDINVERRDGDENDSFTVAPSGHEGG